MKVRENEDYTLIQTKAELEKFYHENKGVSWMGFDTEFVGEKRFFPLLCLVQVATENGLYLIDPIAVDKLDCLLELLTLPSLEKITHAGENDYRIFYQTHNVVPKNVVDTQIASGFIGYKYPVSFRKLVEGELFIQMDKSFTVTDWEIRPFSKRQISYALEDVRPLQRLWRSLKNQLSAVGRLDWTLQEFAKLESDSYYAKDPNDEILKSNLAKNLSPKEQLFLLRVYTWRRKEAISKNQPKEKILSDKILGQLVRAFVSGKEAYVQNRMIPDKLIKDHGAMFESFLRTPITVSEKGLLEQISDEEPLNPKEEIVMDLMHLIVKEKCYESGVSLNLAMPKNNFKKLRGDEELFNEICGGWRREFLGDAFIQLLQNIDSLEVLTDGRKMELIHK